MQSIIDKYDFFLFDLDDTLYPEIDYLDGAYMNIANFLSKKTELVSQEIYKFLINEFNKNGRNSLFNKLFDEFNIEKIYMQDVLNVMRTYTPISKITLFPKMYRVLPKIIKNSIKVFIVTNGNEIQQKNKVSNIDWKLLDKSITFIYANEYNRKPSVDSFYFIEENFPINKKSAIMIGDSFFDKKYAENCKIDFMFVEKFNSLVD